jgi:FkbM family methyltransferase
VPWLLSRLRSPRLQGGHDGAGKFPSGSAPSLTVERECIKAEILKRQGFYDGNGRLKRVCKRPLHTLSYYAVQIAALQRPFIVHRDTPWGDRLGFYLPECGSIYKNGYFEANVVNLFVSLLEEGDVFFDIGAHIGYYSTLASTLVGAGGRVVSFEPTPRTFALLAENVRSKNNVEVHNLAALDREQEIIFYDYGPAFGALNSTARRSSDPIPFRPTAEEIRVKTIAIDSLCAKEGIVPTVIKIDAEGAEPRILAGMPFILDTARPLITIEVCERWLSESSKAIEMLQAKGYECFEVSSHGTLSRWTPRTYRRENLLFVHSAKCDRIRSLIA